MSKFVFSDAENLKRYLQVIAVVPDYSLNNQMLLYYQCNESGRTITRLRDRDGWGQRGIPVPENSFFYNIYEPDKDENGEVIRNEKTGEPAGYHFKQMYDGADVGYAEKENVSAQALEALLTRQDVPVLVVDEIKNMNGVRARYAEKEKCIYVVRSSKVPADDFFVAIATEMGHAICHDNMKDKNMAYNRAQYHFTCCAAAYALAEAFHVSQTALNLDIIPDRMMKMGERAAKNEIGRIAGINRMIAKDMRMPLEKIMGRDAEIREAERNAAGA